MRLKLFIKLSFIFLIVCAANWIPLVCAYDYEAALCAAILGIFCIPILSPEPTPTYEPAKTSLIALAFFISVNILWIALSWWRGELCNLSDGLAYQCLIAFPANLCTALLWRIASKISKFSIVHFTIYVLFIAIDWCFSIYILYHGPAIVSFGQTFGFFAGSIYDESINIFRPLALYRIGSFAFIICLYMALCANKKTYQRLILTIIGFIIAFSWHFILSSLEYLPPISNIPVKKALWAEITSPDNAFAIHFMPRSKSREDLKTETDELYRAYQNDYQFLKNFFQTQPKQKIHIWIYPDAQTKGKYIGAQHTSFARVWKYETHLVNSPPHTKLARHEMAHLFATSFGNPPLQLAGGWSIPAMGWIEGLATAAQWPTNDFTPHEWSEAILRQPSGQSITPLKLLYGFWGFNSRMAYTLAGSFVRYLIDTYGIEKVKQLSQNMPAEFKIIIHRDINDVFDDWKIFLKNYHASQKANDILKYVFSSSSIFTKKCARNKAKQQQSFYRCLYASDCDIKNLSPICGSAQPSIDTLEYLWSIYVARGATDANLSNANPNIYPQITSLNQCAYLKNDTASSLRSQIYSLYHNCDFSEQTDATRLIWYEHIADMTAHSRQFAAASILYRTLLTLDLPRATIRRLEIKYRASIYSNHYISNILFSYFAQSPEISIERESVLYSNAPILAYLDYISAIYTNNYPRARRALTRMILAMPHHHPVSSLPAGAWLEIIRTLPDIHSI